MKELLQNKNVAILGLGLEGLSSAQYLIRNGVKVTICDEKEERDFEPFVLEEAKKLPASFVFGTDAFKNLQEYDFVVRSPGIKVSALHLEPSKITSQTKLFFDLCPSEIIGVTGTKGKGTTSSLIYEMLKQQGYDAYLGGNIGKPPFDFLDSLTPQSKVVLELSSYQLEDITKSPHIAVILMITQDHLLPDRKLGVYENYHEDLYSYIDAKRNIVRFQKPTDFAVINRDYPASHESDIYSDGKIYQVSRERESLEDGCFIKDNTVIVRRNGQNEEIIPVEDIVLLGKHNLENVCASVMVAKLSGVQTKHIVHVLKTFTGLAHRLEFVTEINGVRYFDDSISTTPETAIAAIQAFSSPEVLILGGASKNSDFSQLGREIAKAENIRAIIGIGQEWPKIKEEILKYNKAIFMVEGAENMKQIIKAVSTIAQPGDVVLLSPGCSSFDMFKSYKDRGNQFKNEVKSIA